MPSVSLYAVKPKERASRASRPLLHVGARPQTLAHHDLHSTRQPLANLCLLRLGSAGTPALRFTLLLHYSRTCVARRRLLPRAGASFFAYLQLPGAGRMHDAIRNTEGYPALSLTSLHDPGQMEMGTRVKRTAVPGDSTSTGTSTSTKDANARRRVLPKRIGVRRHI